MFMHMVFIKIREMVMPMCTKLARLAINLLEPHHLVEYRFQVTHLCQGLLSNW